MEYSLATLIKGIISLMRLSLGREAFFCAKLLRPWATSSAAALSVGYCDREPPQIFSYL